MNNRLFSDTPFWVYIPLLYSGYVLLAQVHSLDCSGVRKWKQQNYYVKQLQQPPIVKFTVSLLSTTEYYVHKSVYTWAVYVTIYLLLNRPHRCRKYYNRHLFSVNNHVQQCETIPFSAALFLPLVIKTKHSNNLLQPTSTCLSSVNTDSNVNPQSRCVSPTFKPLGDLDSFSNSHINHTDLRFITNSTFLKASFKAKCFHKYKKKKEKKRRWMKSLVRLTKSAQQIAQC